MKVFYIYTYCDISISIKGKIKQSVLSKVQFTLVHYSHYMS